MSLKKKKKPCEVIVLCLFSVLYQTTCFFFFFSEESRQYPIYILATAKVPSEHTFHHVECNAELC